MSGASDWVRGVFRPHVHGPLNNKIYTLNIAINKCVEKNVAYSIHCVQKKEQNVFVISSTKQWQLWWNLVHSFRNKFAAKWLNVSHLTWLLSLHYLVKLEMLVAHVLSSSCYRKELRNLSHLNSVLQIRQIWIQLITLRGTYCKRRCTKHASPTNGCYNDDMIQLGQLRSQSLFQFVQISNAYFVDLLLQYSHVF